MKSTDTVESRVGHGAALLDRSVPGWADKINLERLNMINCYRCVLGQLFGHYLDGISCLTIYGGGPFFGFNVSDSDIILAEMKDKYKELHDAWISEIKKRKNDQYRH